jgi:hypothetical protein
VNALLTKTLDALEIGKPLTHGNLTMIPLLGGLVGDPDDQTLDEALRAGTMRVMEVPGAASVSELTLQNHGDRAVLLLDGEELVGAKQNRVLNLTILAPAGKELLIPVSCVEAGRWSDGPTGFASAPRAHYAAGRARKNAAVTASMRSTGARLSDQGEVWADISAKAHRMAAASPTAAMAAMFEGHAAGLEAFVEALPPVEGQAGAAFFIGSQLIGLDWFDQRATLRTLLPKLVRSYALDAIDAGLAAPGAHAAGADPDSLKALLHRLKDTPAQAFRAIGEGEDLRLTGEGFTASALVARGRVVHLCAFHAHGPGARGRHAARSRISRPSVRRRHPQARKEESMTMKKTVATRIVECLQQAAGPLCDDCLAPLAALSWRQQANATAWKLRQQGKLDRFKGTCSLCGSDKWVSRVSGALGAAGQERGTTAQMEVKALTPTMMPKGEGLEILGYTFGSVGPIRPESDGFGKVQHYRPHLKYDHATATPLNPYGAGPFCRFRIPADLTLEGVYLLRVDEQIVYLGKCDNLAVRFNSGYGQIAPRNCYKGGQNTNCKVNRRVLHEIERGRQVELWFCPVGNPLAVEKSMLAALAPTWNGHL